MKKNTPLIIIGVLLALFVVAIVLSPSPADKRFTYSKDHIAPHGCSILFNELGTIFPNASVEVSDSSYFSLLKNYQGDNAAYIYISDNFGSYSQNNDTTLYVLDEFVAQGNQVFLSANYIYQSVKSIAFSEFYEYNKDVDSMFVSLLASDSLQATIPSSNNYDDPSYFDASINKHIDESRLDSVYQLGSVKVNYYQQNTEKKDTLINFVRIPHGKGNYFIFSSPQMLTNYFFLDEKRAEYATGVLSHLGDVDHVIWDEYYKPGMSFMGNRSSGSYKKPMYIFEEFPALKAAFMVFLIGVLLLLVTKFRRNQRALAVIHPPKNRTVEFTTTMGRLYFKKGEHLELAKKMITYFEFGCRKKYGIKEFDYYENHIDKLAKQTQLDNELLKEYFKNRSLLKRSKHLSEHQLIRINRIINQLKKK